jgi:hypothetical protein
MAGREVVQVAQVLTEQIDPMPQEFKEIAAG